MYHPDNLQAWKKPGKQRYVELAPIYRVLRQLSIRFLVFSLRGKCIPLSLLHTTEQYLLAIFMIIAYNLLRTSYFSIFIYFTPCGLLSTQRYHNDYPQCFVSNIVYYNNNLLWLPRKYSFTWAASLFISLSISISSSLFILPSSTFNCVCGIIDFKNAFDFVIWEMDWEFLKNNMLRDKIYNTNQGTYYLVNFKVRGTGWCKKILFYIPGA